MYYRDKKKKRRCRKEENGNGVNQVHHTGAYIMITKISPKGYNGKAPNLNFWGRPVGTRQDAPASALQSASRAAYLRYDCQTISP
jgi:hypothetical protein